MTSTTQIAAAHTAARASSEKLLNIQALRGIAAYLVVFHHVVDSWNNYTGKIYAFPLQLDIGATGVDLFFVISGFIMVWTSTSDEGAPGRFFKKRVVRVMPLYWLLTVIAACVSIAGFKLFGNTTPDSATLIQDLFFIPHTDARNSIAHPTLFVGWTLNYEMFFYALFAIQLAFGHAMPRLIFFPLVFGFIAIAAIFMPNNPWLQYYANSIVWEFALGMLIAAQFHRGAEASTQTAWICIVLGAALLALSTFLGDAFIRWRGIVSGVPATLVVYGALALEQRGHRLESRIMQSFGDASYSIYLVHPFVLQIMGKIMIVAGMNLTLLGLGAGYALMFIVTAIVGTALYRWVETPLSRWARAFLLPRGKRVVAPA